MGLRTDLNSERISELRSDEVEGKTEVLTIYGKGDFARSDQGTIETQSSTPPEHDHTRPINTRAGDAQNPQNTHEPAVMKLPPELLSPIFTNCREWKDFAVILPRTRWFPWVLGEVCSQWRRTLYSTSEIWSTIEIRSDLPQRKQEILPGLVDQVAARVHGPLKFQAPLLEVEAFTKVITPYAGRFLSLTLTLSFDLLGTFLNLPLHLTSLRSLQIIVVKKPLLHPVVTRRTDALRNTPHLDTFFIMYLHHFKRTYTLSELWLPWSQLTSFQCRGPLTAADLHGVLSHCTALNKCSVVVREFLEGEAANYTHQTIVLPHLRTLSIEPFAYSVDWILFLQPFVLPSLGVLECHDWQVLEAFEALVARSGCHLEELNCFMRASFANPLDTGRLCHLLRMSPSLTVLGNLPLTPVVFDLISCGNLLPHITTLDCCVDIDGLDAFLNLMEQYPQGKGMHTARIFLYIPVYNEEDDPNRRFLSARERFVAEGRDIALVML